MVLEGPERRDGVHLLVMVAVAIYPSENGSVSPGDCTLLHVITNLAICNLDAFIWTRGLFTPKPRTEPSFMFCARQRGPSRAHP